MRWQETPWLGPALGDHVRYRPSNGTLGQSYIRPLSGIQLYVKRPWTLSEPRSFIRESLLLEFMHSTRKEFLLQFLKYLFNSTGESRVPETRGLNRYSNCKRPAGSVQFVHKLLACHFKNQKRMQVRRGRGKPYT
jgi:hypothetical protein